MPQTWASAGLSAIARIAMPVRLQVRNTCSATMAASARPTMKIWSGSMRTPGSTSTAICSSRV